MLVLHVYDILKILLVFQLNLVTIPVLLHAIGKHEVKQQKRYEISVVMHISRKRISMGILLCNFCHALVSCILVVYLQA